jgi:hypothetical protein
MEIIYQKDFPSPSDRELLKKLDDEPLVVHRRQDGGEGIIIFVHGLGVVDTEKIQRGGNFQNFFMRIFRITILAFTNTAPCSEGPSFGNL